MFVFVCIKFHDAIDAFKNQDIEKARRLMLDYKTDISSVSTEIVDSIISGKSGDFTSMEAGSLCPRFRPPLYYASATEN